MRVSHFLNFEGGPGVPLLNIRGVPSPTFKLWGGFRVLGIRVAGTWSHFYTMPLRYELTFLRIKCAQNILRREKTLFKYKRWPSKFLKVNKKFLFKKSKKWKKALLSHLEKVRNCQKFSGFVRQVLQRV